jgi:hypothetical protein
MPALWMSPFIASTQPGTLQDSFSPFPSRLAGSSEYGWGQCSERRFAVPLWCPCQADASLEVRTPPSPLGQAFAGLQCRSVCPASPRGVGFRGVCRGAGGVDARLPRGHRSPSGHRAPSLGMHTTPFPHPLPSPAASQSPSPGVCCLGVHPFPGAHPLLCAELVPGIRQTDANGFLPLYR